VALIMGRREAAPCVPFRDRIAGGDQPLARGAEDCEQVGGAPATALATVQVRFTLIVLEAAFKPGSLHG
jgi:hypothetical protein